VRNKRRTTFYLPLFLFAAAHVIIFRFVFDAGNDLLFQQASAVFSGQLPYRDFLLEYPPLTLAVLLPPRLFGADTGLYGRAFSYEMLVLDLGILVLIAATARRMRLPSWQALGAYTAALLALGSLAAQRYDLWPALLVAAAFFCFARGNYTLCWFFLALGVTTKLYPAMLAPLLALYQLKRRDFRGLARGVAAFAVTTIAIVLPWVALSPEGLRTSVYYHLDRGLHMESTYASALLVGQNLGLTNLRVEFVSGSNDVVSSLADKLAGLSAIVAVLALAGVYFAYARKKVVRMAGGALSAWGEAGDMAIWWSLTLVVFLVSSRVLSPQFLIWLMPLMALVSVRARWWAWALLTVAGAASQYIFPSHYYDLMDFKSVAVAVLVVRNAVLVLLAGLLLRWGLAPSAAPGLPRPDPD